MILDSDENKGFIGFVFLLGIQLYPMQSGSSFACSFERGTLLLTVCIKVRGKVFFSVLQNLR